MEKNKLSVITPFFNEQDEILNLLKDFEEFEKKNKVIKEYILINDCSTDSSLSIINNYIDKKKIKKKIKIYNNKKNVGWCKTLLKGYRIAKAENIIFIPGDGEIKLTDCYKNIKLIFGCHFKNFLAFKIFAKVTLGSPGLFFTFTYFELSNLTNSIIFLGFEAPMLKI